MKSVAPNLYIFGLFVLLLLSGCASTKVSEEQATKAVRQAIPELHDTFRNAADSKPVDIGWLATFNDPVLTQLVNEAIRNNLNLQVAATNVERAQALARQAGAQLLPTANLSAGATRSGSLQGGGAGSTSLNTGLQVSWEADLWGRIRAGTAQAALSAQAAEADYRFAQYSVAGNTVLAYILAIESMLQTKTAEKSLVILQKTLSIVKVQYDEGMTSSQDLALTRTDIASAKERVQALKNAESSSLRALELLLGRYPSADAIVQQSLPRLPPAPSPGIPSSLLERRPDLIAAERRIASAFNAVDQAKAARLPGINLTANLGAASNDLSDLLDPGNVAWQLGSSLLAPLFDGGVRKESVVIATAEQRAAVAQYADAALKAFSDVESALEQGEGLAYRLEQSQEAARQAAKAYQLAELLHKEGESSLLDLLSVQQRLISTESNVVALRRALLEQRVGLNLALGGKW